MLAVDEIVLVNFLIITAGILFTIALSEYFRRFRPDLGESPLITLYHQGMLMLKRQ